MGRTYKQAFAQQALAQEFARNGFDIFSAQGSQALDRAIEISGHQKGAGPVSYDHPTLNHSDCKSEVLSTSMDVARIQTGNRRSISIRGGSVIPATCQPGQYGNVTALRP
jgi:hypothetical protein